nr:hypothetical protein [Tanacetum cinerariifolium]
MSANGFQEISCRLFSVQTFGVVNLLFQTLTSEKYHHVTLYQQRGNKTCDNRSVTRHSIIHDSSSTIANDTGNHENMNNDTPESTSANDDNMFQNQTTGYCRITASKSPNNGNNVLFQLQKKHRTTVTVVQGKDEVKEEKGTRVGLAQVWTKSRQTKPKPQGTGAGPLTATADHSTLAQKLEKLNSWGSDIIASRAVGAVLQKLRYRKAINIRPTKNAFVKSDLIKRYMIAGLVLMLETLIRKRK